MASLPRLTSRPLQADLALFFWHLGSPEGRLPLAHILLQWGATSGAVDNVYGTQSCAGKHGFRAAGGRRGAPSRGRPAGARDTWLQRDGMLRCPGGARAAAGGEAARFDPARLDDAAHEWLA